MPTVRDPKPKEEQKKDALIANQEDTDKPEKKYDTWDGLPELVEYINVTPSNNMFIEIYGDDEERKPVRIAPGQAFYMNPKDRRKYRDDARWVDGSVVINSPDIEAMMVKTGDNVMTDPQITFLVNKAENASQFAGQLEPITNVDTLKRIRLECGEQKQDKPISYIRAIDERMMVILKEQHPDSKIIIDGQGHHHIEQI